MVSDCKLKWLGELPFGFEFGTCGTFLIDNMPTLLLCFEYYERKLCRTLTRKNDGALNDINDFVFQNEFELNGIAIPRSNHAHHWNTIANYQGYPFILGGWNNGGNNKLEMLNIKMNPPRWIERAEYPFSNM